MWPWARPPFPGLQLWVSLLTPTSQAAAQAQPLNLIPAPVPTLLGAVLSGGWSRPRVALVSIQVSHPGFHKHCRLGPGFKHMNKSIFTPAPSSWVMTTL